MSIEKLFRSPYSVPNALQVTDEGLDQLAGLTSLQDLKVTRTAVTEQGTTRLQKKLPHVTIQLKYIE